jgi:hypothetical protein
LKKNTLMDSIKKNIKKKKKGPALMKSWTLLFWNDLQF